MVILVRELGKPFGVVINKAHLGNREIYSYLDSENIEIIAEIPFNRLFAEQYARADLFQMVPGEPY